MIKQILAIALLLPIIASAGSLERCITPDGKVFYGAAGGRLGDIHCEKTVKKKEVVEITTKKNIEIIDLHAEALKKKDEEELQKKKEADMAIKKKESKAIEDKKEMKQSAQKSQEPGQTIQIPEVDKNTK